MARTGNRVKLTPLFSEILLWLTYGLSLLGVLNLKPIKTDLWLFLGLLGLATAAFILGGRRLLAAPEQATRVIALVLLAVSLRCVGLFIPPEFSTDIFRYIYEGRLVWHEGITFAFLVSPSAAVDAGIPVSLIDEGFRKINNPSIPTIYPPIAQFVFVVAGGISEGLRSIGIKISTASDIVIMKTLLLICEFTAYGFISLAIKTFNRNHKNEAPVSQAWVILLALFPVGVIEIAREGHADSIAMLGLALAVFGFAGQRISCGHFGFVIAALAKLIGGVGLLVGLRANKKRSLRALALLLLLGLPYAVLSLQSGRGLSEYASRWQSFDGTFSVLLHCTQWLIDGDWVRLGAWTITRHQLARFVTAVIFVTCLAIRLRQKPSLDKVTSITGELFVLLFLITPSLHPWYLISLLPFIPFMHRGRNAAIYMLCLAPLMHHGLFISGSADQDLQSLWIRLGFHFPAWFLLVLSCQSHSAAQRNPSDQLQS